MQRYILHQKKINELLKKFSAKKLHTYMCHKVNDAWVVYEKSLKWCIWQEKLSILNLDDIINDVTSDIMDDVIHSLKSYIRRGVRFHGAQHRMISLSIHRFGSGTVHWSSGNYLLLLLLVSEFISFDQFIMECLWSLYADVIKNFVLIIQGIDHIGITQSG